ncbi:MAG: hypothetical protein IJB83_03225 [Bacilli bacterium]|nr:hypothetical protein [Bacilli bacterium]
MLGFEDCFEKLFENKNYLVGKIFHFRVPSNKEKGFNFEYILMVPEKINENTSLIYEGMNYSTNKNFSEKEAIDYIYENSKSFRNPIFKCNNETNYPIIMPLIPRYYDDDLGIEVFTTQFSSTCLLDSIKEKYKRIDNQIVNMIDDAIERLNKNSIKVDKKIIIHGFSSSAKFANRFTILHPSRVKLCIAGGLAGFLTLPIRELNGERLIYPVGIGNISEITDDMLEEFKKIKQYYYQGNQDKIDAFASTKDDNYDPYFKSIISHDELVLLYKILGRKIEDRWSKTQYYYNSICKNVLFKTYNGGHEETDEIINDISQLLKG